LAYPAFRFILRILGAVKTTSFFGSGIWYLDLVLDLVLDGIACALLGALLVFILILILTLIFIYR